MNLLMKDWKYGKDLGILIIRFMAGFLLLYGHGFGKLSTIFSGQDIQFMDPIGIGPAPSFYLAAVAEGVCAILLVLGLFTRVAAAILVINFLVIVSFHLSDGFQILEMRWLYLFSFIALFFTGGGRLSLDQLFFKRHTRAL